MSHDEIAKDEFDVKLSRLFAENNEPLQSDEFIQQMMSRLQREYRMRWIRRACITIIVLLLAAIVAPWAARATSGLFLFAGYIGKVPNIHTITIFGMMLISCILAYRARYQLR